MTTLIQGGAASASTALPRAQDIEQGLRDGSDPLDFIRQNLRTANQQPQQQPNQQAQVPPSVVADKPSFVDKDIGLELPHETPIPTKTAETPPVKAEDVPSSTLPTSAEAAKGPEESLKHLRRKTGELSRTVEEKAAEALKLQEELERYKTGEAIPEVVETLKSRVNELEHYEQLHNLRMSPDYTTKYVEPIEGLKEKAVAVANEYEVDPTVLDAAYAIKSKRERNAFLAKHFDDVGALEVRNTLEEIERISIAAQEAETKPQETLEALREEQRQHAASQEKQRIERISQTAKSGWVETLTKLRSEGKYPELTLTGDAEHDKYVRPILNEAAAEFGKVIKEMGLTGVKELRSETAKMLAERFLLSQATAVAMESRQQHHQRAEEAINSAKREAAFIRPQVGGGAVTPTGIAPRQPNNPMEAADEVLRRIGMK